MKRVLLGVGFGLVLLLSQLAAAATPEQAQRMVERAADFLRLNGPEKTFAAIDDPKGPFKDGDLYVFVHDKTGLIRAHGGFPSYIGTNTIWARDRNGKEFVREIVNVATSKWIAYEWLNPISMVTEQKIVYVLRVGDLFLCSGAYAEAPGKQ